MATAATNTWKDLDFTNLQQILDEQSSKIGASQEEAAASRKALSAKTKAFRKLADEEKLGEIRSLLKGYQAEIDSLTSRCKFAESSFMNAYKSLALLPDPEPLLNSKQAEIERLQKELSSSSTSAEKESSLARQLEIQTLRIAQLEKQLKSRPDQSTSVDTSLPGKDSNGSSTASLDQKVYELETEFAQKQSELVKTQASLKEQLQLSQKQQEDLRRALDKIAAQQDYEDIKRELADLQMQNQNNATSATDPGAQVAPGNDSDAAVQRRTVKKLEMECQELRDQNTELKAEVTKCKALVAKLEEDLSSLKPSDTFSTVSGWTAVPRDSAGSTLGSGGLSTGTSAVSNIIIQQRDRYKRRMQDLEEKTHATENALAQSQKELDKVKRESYTLFERIRQLQAGGGAAAAAAAAATNRTTLPNKSLYEPSTEQQLKELDIDRRLVGLNPVNAEAVKLFARAVVDQKLRTGIAAYAALVHLLALAGLIY